MSRFANKKDLETFSNNLQKLSNDLDNITNNVDDISNQFNDYNEQISDIKENVKSLETELKSFMHEVKVSPIIENATKQIIKDKEELNKKYSRYNIIRERLLNIINNPNDKELLLTNEEQINYNIPNFYLSFVLMSINNYLKTNKESKNTIKQALNLNYEKTALILMIFNINLNNDNEAIRWLNNYLDKINPKSTNNTLVKLIDYFKDTKHFLNIILEKLNTWKDEINEDNELYNTILNNWYNSFNLNNKLEEYPCIYEYCYEYESLINDLDYSNIYTNAYNKINSYINNSNTSNIDLLYDTIYSCDGKELELKDSILKHELIIKNNGIIKEIKHIIDKDIFSVFLICLNNKKYTKQTKEILLKYSESYINELLNENTVNNKDVTLKIDNWTSKTLDGNNEKELIESIEEYINKPYIEELNKANAINFKTIYSLSFILIGIIVLIFNTTIGFSMIGVGIIMLIYFIYDINNYKKNLKNTFDEALNNVKLELYDLIAEIVDIKLIINNNLKNKTKLENYLNRLKENN